MFINEYLYTTTMKYTDYFNYLTEAMMMSYSQLVYKFATELKKTKKYKKANINKVIKYCIENPDATIRSLEIDPELNTPELADRETQEIYDQTRNAIYVVFVALGREKRKREKEEREKEEREKQERENNI